MSNLEGLRPDWGNLNQKVPEPASPRIGSGTYENSSRWLLVWVPELWLIAV
jgi:hypothetical protein